MAHCPGGVGCDESFVLQSKNLVPDDVCVVALARGTFQCNLNAIESLVYDA